METPCREREAAAVAVSDVVSISWLQRPHVRGAAAQIMLLLLPAPVACPAHLLLKRLHDVLCG